ncbi:methyltransferase domain-containing protein [Chitinophaga horti]|uniref:Methyltransferase domain-containing protein n=1 Tax=Chitinophaga horti TaxID=2920382 RepID=A0ABY6J895_9BACT|nr:class I SAM-dependent methyltransferase [Chitinophaga horti]UYQ95901.1 methyltransferase domain-containing protein [Chitinophaga horti]
MQSPVTRRENVSLITSFPSSRIIEEYRHEGVSVERFFTGIKEVGLYECGDTGYRFYWPENIFGDGAFYADLQRNQKEYYPEAKWEHHYATGQINAGEQVLEVGAGDGVFLKMLKNKGIIAHGLELNPEGIADARAQGLSMDGESVQDHAARFPGKYDVVCAFQVLEHIYDVHDFLTACVSLLRKGGRLIIGVPNNNPFLYRYDSWHTLNLPPHHAGLWGRKAFGQMPKWFGLGVEQIIVEPLHPKLGQYKKWFEVQKAHYREHNPLLYQLMRITPRPLYKVLMRVCSPAIEGRNIIGIFKKA